MKLSDKAKKGIGITTLVCGFCFIIAFGFCFYKSIQTKEYDPELSKNYTIAWYVNLFLAIICAGICLLGVVMGDNPRQ